MAIDAPRLMNLLLSLMIMSCSSSDDVAYAPKKVQIQQFDDTDTHNDSREITLINERIENNDGKAASCSDVAHFLGFSKDLNIPMIVITTACRESWIDRGDPSPIFLGEK